MIYMLCKIWMSSIYNIVYYFKYNCILFYIFTITICNYNFLLQLYIYFIFIITICNYNFYNIVITENFKT